MYIGGLDIGTTGCKLTLFDEKGKLVSKQYRDYPVQRLASEHVINAENIYDAVLEVIRRTTENYPDIAGIGVTSFGETFIAADEAGKPLFPSMLYTDPRGDEEKRELAEKLGEEHIAEISGLKPHEMYSLPKLMWLKKHEPDTFARVRHVFLMEDFIVFRLTGKAVIDYSLASRTMGFDIQRLSWSEEIFDAAGIDPELMSRPVPTGTSAGPVARQAAKETGLCSRTQVICMSHDQIAAAVGSGVFDPSTAVDGAGTVECVTPVYDHIPDIGVMMRGNFAVVPYVIPGTYVCYAFSYTGGALIQWCTETLAKKEKELADADGISVNEYLEKVYGKRRGEEPSGMLVLPHFAGAATPYMDTGSRGAILGLTTDTHVSDIYRACMEGVVYEMQMNLEYLKDSGISFTKLHATGGGAHSKVWMQMKADILNREIIAMETVDAGTVGSAMMTGIAVGVFQDLAEAAKVMVHPVKTYHPNPAMHEKYEKFYERYRGLYRAVRPLIV